MSRATFELKSQLFRAGAGAGKTTKLVSHVLEIIQHFRKEHGRFPRLVVTTFTRKATQELRERLLIEGQKTQDPELLNYLMSKNELYISTIHGVLHLLLARFGSRLGLDPGMKFMSSEESSRKVKRILKKLILDSAEYSELVSELGFSGLARIMRDYYKSYFLHPEFKPLGENSLRKQVSDKLEEIASLASEAADRIQKEATSEEWIHYSLDLKSLSKILKYEAYAQWREALQKLKKPRSKKAGPSDETLSQVKEMIAAFDEITDKGYYDPEVSRQAIHIWLLLHKLGQEFSHQVLEEKKSSGQIDIDDLELFSLQLLRDHSEIATQFNQERDYWMIDEFQDTSPLQVQLLHSLIKETPHFVVGDPQQSIYFFRGARSEVFIEKEKEILSRGGEKGELQTNYRSTPELLRFLNKVVGSYGFVEMEPRPRKEEESIVPEVATIGVFSSDAEEMRFVTNEVTKLLNSGVPPESICVLMRKNDDLKSYAHFMSQHDIPTQLHAASGFFQRREILDMLALLKFLANPHDDKNLVQLLRSPWFRMPDDGLLEMIQNRQKDQSFWQSFKSLDIDIIKELVAAQTLLPELGIVGVFERTLIHSGLIDFSHHHDATGQRESNIWKLIMSLRHQSVQPGFSIHAFIKNSAPASALEDFDGDSDAVAAFEPARVNLMTIHMSKGLQFDYVFVPKMGDKKSPARRPKFYVKDGEWVCDLPLGEDGAQMGTLISDEERTHIERSETEELWRLFYVAVTRARQKVYLSAGEKRSSPSWWDRFNLDLTQETHKTEHYQYSVVTEVGDSEILNVRKKERVSAYAPLLYKAGAGPLLSVSVSQLLEPLKEKEVSVQAVFSESRLQKTARGVLVHKVFESLHYLGEARLKQTVDSLFESDADEVLETVSFVLNNKQVPFRELIQNGYAEWGFLIREKDLIIEGQIDLWGRVGEGLWVVDYKTGRSENAEKAFRQLALYALALQIKGETGPYRLAVVFPFEKKVLTREITDLDLERLRHLVHATPIQNQYREPSLG